jgi:hypothetical protein
MHRVLFACCLALLCVLPAIAQETADGILVETSTGPYDIGDTFEATLRLSSTPGNLGVGTSTIVIDFDDAAITFAEAPVVAVDYAFANYVGFQATRTGGNAAYNASVVRTNSARLTVVIDLGFTTDGNGQALPGTSTDVVALRFTVADPSRSTALTFDNVQLFDGPGTAYTNGVFTGLDAALPVELTGFEARQGENGVQLLWETASERGNAGFDVQRRVDAEVGSEADADSWERVTFVQGAGTTAEAQQYAFTDTGVPFTAQRVTYRLRQVDYDGASAFSAPIEVEVGTPLAFKTHGVFPNPVQRATTLRYELPTETRVRVEIYDVLGRRVALVADEEKEAGRYELPLDAQRLAGGLYLVRVQTPERSGTQQMIVVR